MENLDRYVRKVPDFPIEGVLFRDIGSLLSEHFGETIDTLGRLLNHAEWSEIDAVVGVEARGFILAAALAASKKKGFVPVRKAGKLPPPVVSQSYCLEYGLGTLQMQPGTGSVVIVDDVLATGGTLRAAADLSLLAGFRVRQLAVLIDLGMLPNFYWQELRLRSAIQY